MGKPNLRDSLKDEYGLTGLEVDDIMRYMKSLCTEFSKLARKYKSEYLIELKDHAKKAQNTKAEKNVFLKSAKFAVNRLSSPAKELKKQFSKTQTSRKLLTTALHAHKIEGDYKRAVTQILGFMSETGQLRDEEQVITGRRAFESLLDIGMGN